MAAFLSGS